MFDFFRCIGQALVAKGIRGILGEIPFAGCLFEMGFDAHSRWRRHAEEARLRAELQAVAAAGADEVKRAAHEVSEEVAAGHPPAVRGAVASYLVQVPAAVRRSFRRLDDPAGRSLPISLSLRRPEDLLALLPMRPCRFKPGDRPLAGGNWELEELLGVGGFGEVWKARHPRLRNIPPVALKFCLDAEAAASLRHEAALLDQVMGHGADAGIVALRNAYLDGDPVCLEYEYVEGGDLTGLIAAWDSKRRLAEAPALMASLSAIVGRMHSLTPPVVHRDLKPANVLVRRKSQIPNLKSQTEDGSGFDVLVADFGIGGVAAGQEVRAERLGTQARGDLLATVLRGACTPLYAGPQQKAGDPPDVRDDVHALGVMWFQLVTGDLGRGVGPDYADDLRELGMADELVKLLGACVSGRPDRRPASASALAEKLAESVKGSAPPPPPAPKQKGELIVAKTGVADHRTIGDALRAAPPHARIRVRPGVYLEGLSLDKPVEIVGDGPLAEVVIEAHDDDCVSMKTDEAIVRGLTLRCRAGAKGHKKFAVDIPQGRLILEHCDITSDSLACIGVHGSMARPVVRHCRIHGGKEGGVFVYKGAQGLYEECEITDNGLAGFESREGANPTVRKCRIHTGKQCGLMVGDDGKALVEDCVMEGNALAGIEIKKNGDPLVKRCRILGGKATGVYAHDHAKGTLEDCGIAGNATSGITVKGFSDPVLRRCALTGNTHSGIACYEGALGTFEDCELSGNERLGLTSYDNANPTLRRCRVHGNKQGGTWAYEEARGLYEDCDIWGNEKSGVNISKGGHPAIRRCKVRDGLAGGVFVFEKGKGLLEDCDISGNTLANLEIREESEPTLRGCKIRDGKASGASIHGQGRGLLERCDLFGNASSNVVIKTGADPVLRLCKVHDGKASGVFVPESGRGTLEKCDIWGNLLAGIEVREQGSLVVRGCRIRDGKASGVFINMDGKVLVEDCDITDNLAAGVVACERGEPTVRHCRVSGSKANGIFFYKGGMGLVESCEVMENEKAGFEIREESKPVVRGCKVSRNGYEGVWVHDQGGGVVENCDLTGNKRGPWDVAPGCALVRRNNKE